MQWAVTENEGDPVNNKRPINEMVLTTLILCLAVSSAVAATFPYSTADFSADMTVTIKLTDTNQP